MIKKLVNSIKIKAEIIALGLLFISTIIATTYYNYNKKIVLNNYKNLINNIYLKQGTLNVEILGRGFAWLDTGTHESLLEASHFIQTIEVRQGYKIACLEEIALTKGWLSPSQIITTAEAMGNSGYGKYLLEIAREYD